MVRTGASDLEACCVALMTPAAKLPGDKIQQSAEPLPALH